jgi:hypothetical protein
MRRAGVLVVAALVWAGWFFAMMAICTGPGWLRRAHVAEGRLIPRELLSFLRR